MARVPVDGNVLLDILAGDAEWFGWSSDKLAQLRSIPFWW